MSSKKQQIRERIQKLRKDHNLVLRVEKDNKIAETLFGLDEFGNSETVLIYVATDDEVETINIILKLMEAGRTVVVPRVDASDMPSLTLHKITNLGELELGSYGILEPSATTPQVGTDSIDLVVVPGVAFDRELHRIGFGKGFYDSLLGDLGCPKIALAYELQIVQNVPVETHDQKVDMIITENEIIR